MDVVDKRNGPFDWAGLKLLPKLILAYINGKVKLSMKLQDEQGIPFFDEEIGWM